MKWKRPLQRLGLVLGMLFLLALAGEAVLRMLSPKAGMEPLLRTGDPALPVVLAPSREGWLAGAFVHINAEGLREDREIPLEKAEGVLRIACVGDSITFGQGVEAAQAFPKLLEKALDAPGRRVEVLNFGVPGQNTVIEAEYLRRKVLAWHPDRVLLTITLNDIEDEPYQDLSRRPWHVRVLSRSLLLQWLAPQAGAALRAAGMGGRTTETGYRDGYRPESSSWARMREALSAMDADCRRSGARLAVLIHTDLGPPLDERYPLLDIHARIEGFCRSRGIPAASSFPEFRGGNPAALKVHPLDAHPNAEGHRRLMQAWRALFHCHFPQVG